MSKKIIFMGTPQFSIRTLESLIKSKFEVVCVYTQPPQKSARGQKIKKSIIHNYAETLNLKIRTPQSLDNEIEFDFFKSLNPFLVVVVAYGKIIPKKYLKIPEKGFINIHASLLPKWRGAAPIQRSIINHDKQTGITFMKIEENLDEGPYYKQFKIAINEHTTSKSLSDSLSKLGSENIVECLELLENDKAEFIEQDHSKATYAKKINKSESKINWNDKAQNIISKINGLNPSPGAWFLHEGSRYKIWKATISKLKGKPGEILDKEFTVACKEGSISIMEIQKEGKNALTIDKFLAGYEIKKGIILE